MKRMLEVEGNTFKINSSSAEILHTCRKKAYYALERGLRPKEESEAMSFGTAIHKALEAFYSSDFSNGERLITEQELHEAFISAAQPIMHVPAGEKRSVENGKKILTKYLETYSNDPWQTVRDSNGKPMVELKFELPMQEDIVLHGQIDCLLQNRESGEIVVCDHKTASTLGVDFFNRIKPNLQFSVYAWAARQLGFPVSKVMVNGIQVAKTKTEFVRVFTNRDAEDDLEMRDSITDAIRLYTNAKNTNVWAINSASCSHYGGCSYRDICSLSTAYRETAIDQLYGNRT
jgi:CRISPR/Cas system-associated exonuclease Cas4 (RecB family)